VTNPPLKISDNEIIRSHMTALVNLSCRRVYQFAVRIEYVEKSNFAKRHVGLIFFNASAFTKNDASIALSGPQNRTVRRVAS
jgi:hypothetical protein